VGGEIHLAFSLRRYLSKNKLKTLGVSPGMEAHYKKVVVMKKEEGCGMEIHYSPWSISPSVLHCLDSQISKKYFKGRTERVSWKTFV